LYRRYSAYYSYGFYIAQKVEWLVRPFLTSSSNPRHHQNLIYFDLSKLAKRPLLGRQYYI
jgi:hypothetical protein